MTTFGQIPEKQGNVQYALDVSADKRALTFTFSDLEIQGDGGKSPATNWPHSRPRRFDSPPSAMAASDASRLAPSSLACAGNLESRIA